MTFNSIQYAAFLVAVLIIYWRLDRRAQNVLIVAASYVFYGFWDYRFLSLLVVSTLTDFFVGRGLGVTSSERNRKALLAISVIVNLGILGFFKYAGFFAESAAELIQSLGARPNAAFLDVVLPVGISFYTFQTMSYTFDVFRRRIGPTSDLVAFAAYVSFFPQLVAGPIERARHLMPQLLSTRRRPGPRQVWSSLHLIGAGLFKKVVLADGVAPFVDQAFADPSQASLVLWLGAIGFAIQIYGDFAGYTDIARGSARLMGVDLMENFRQPYLARSISDFWRRWHISLSTWLRDYLYIPMGGNRRGPVATYRNLLVTMLLGGLWHGAGWTFVVWGGLHGLWLAAHRFVSERRDTTKKLVLGPFATVATFVGVTLLWIPFRADSISAAVDYGAGMLSLTGGTAPLDMVMVVGLAFVVMVAVDLAGRGRRTVKTRVPALVRGLAYGVGAATIIVFSGGEFVPFIYFQF